VSITALAGRPPAPYEAKLVPPLLRAGVVPRPELAQRLRQTARSTVALIVAPAGYGKTTLLGQVAEHAGKRPFVWVRVDASDNDPLTFVRCLTTALDRAVTLAAGTPRQRTRASDSHALLAARLVKRLKGVEPLAIAVEDLHLVTSYRSLKIVEAIANNLPPRSQLFLTSRTYPRLGLTALRADGRLIELGTEDLRLSAVEAHDLLRAAGIEGSADDVAHLTARAEGWPTGLYLATLACERHGQELAAFDGSDRFVSDYFGAEYLDAMDADERIFLIDASVLEFPSGPLCDAVLRTSGSAARLARLARSNLFVTRQGSGKAHVYRLHAMLRDTLVAELCRRDPGRFDEIALRAADWMESHGELGEAADYAWAAGDRDRFARIAEEAALPLLQVGQLASIERWIGRLDPDLLEEHPALAVCGAFVHTLRGRPLEAEALAPVAELAPVETVMPDGTPSAEPWIAVLRAAMCRGGKDEMRRDSAHALATLAEDSPLRPTALVLLGAGQLLAGENGAADEILAEAHVAAMNGAVWDTAALAVALRSHLAAADERWDAADELARTASEVLQTEHLEAHPTSPMTFAAGMRAAVHHGDWVRAGNDLERVRDHLPEHAPAWFSVLVHLEVARALAGLSKRDEAAAELAGAESLLADAPDLGVLATQAAELRAELDRGVRPGGTYGRLTPAELRLLPHLATHRTFREIGDHLGISRNTVKTQAICSYRKLGAGSRSEAVLRAVELGLIAGSEALETRPA
jgi:LuxR family maltose regulon positive regulatory protein